MFSLIFFPLSTQNQQFETVVTSQSANESN